MYPRIPKITVARSNRSVNTSIVVMRSPPFGGNNLFHVPADAHIIPRAPRLINLPPSSGFCYFRAGRSCPGLAHLFISASLAAISSGMRHFSFLTQ